MTDEESFCSQEEKNIVKEIVQAIMVLDYSKKPFKQADIFSHTNLKPSRKNWKDIMSEAEKRLKGLGLELHETEDTSSKMYFVVSKTYPLRIMHKYASEEEVSNRILLTIVLAYIFMKNGVVTCDDLLNHLKDLNIYNDSDTSHPYFGCVKKKVLTDFVDQLYLSVKKMSDSDLFEVGWGQRAEIEITKRAILEFVCECGFRGKLKPENLAAQYEKVVAQEAQKGTNDNNSNEPQIVSIE